ncbi:MAG TPA: hypothetical protein VEN81_07825 [Planctomycetota bacterium]|nr:hypothetical protein [Planctomycetota bacterium]
MKVNSAPESLEGQPGLKDDTRTRLQASPRMIWSSPEGHLQARWVFGPSSAVLYSVSASPAPLGETGSAA